MSRENELEQRVKNAADLKELEETLQELLSGPYEVWSNGQLILIKVMVETVKDLMIVIRTNDHPPPHFHVLGQNLNASFDIASGELLEGSLNSRHHRLIRDWWTERARKRLIMIWNETRIGG